MICECPLPNPVYLCFALVVLGVAHSLSRHWRLGVIPGPPDPAWFAVPVETLEKHEAGTSLWSVAAARALYCFNRPFELPLNHTLDTWIAELSAATVFYHRNASHNNAISSFLGDRVPSGGLMPPLFVSNTTIASIFSNGAFRKLDREAGFMRVALSSTAKLVHHLKKSAPGISIGEMAGTNAYSLVAQLPKTVLASEFSTDHRLWIQLRGEAHVNVFYPETTVDLHLYPTSHPRSGFSQLDFRFTSLARKLPCATVHLLPGDALYVPPFYSARVFAPDVSLAFLTTSTSSETMAMGSIERSHSLRSIVAQVAAAAVAVPPTGGESLDFTSGLVSRRNATVVAVIVCFAQALLRGIAVPDPFEELARMVRTRFAFDSELHPVDLSSCPDYYDSIPTLSLPQHLAVKQASKSLLDKVSQVSKAWIKAAKPEEARFVNAIVVYGWVADLLGLLPSQSHDEAMCALGVQIVETDVPSGNMPKGAPIGRDAQTTSF